MFEKMWRVKVYDTFNNTHEWGVANRDKAREYAKRIITEGLWFNDGDEEVFYPVHQVVKVKIGEMPSATKTQP
jgi:hypothetical protein